MTTAAQKKANAKYKKEHVKVITIACHKENDKDIITFLESLPSKQAFIKQAIREKMLRS